MTLEEYRVKYKNISITHPAPEALAFPETNWHYRKIIEVWQLELNAEDYATIKEEEQRFIDKMNS